MHWRTAFRGGLFGLLLLAGCTGSNFIIDITTPPLNAEGHYTSTDTGGRLGHLSLDLTLREGAIRTYDAVLGSLDDPQFGQSEGVGTVGNQHIILNFDPGSNVDYYFEGTFTLDNAGLVSGIEGSFIWPDQQERLDASFSRQSS